jgi:capsule polysaccharide modification protein KpsS
VPPDEVRPLDSSERAEVEAFIRDFTARGRPILAHRRAVVTMAKLRDFARHVYVRAVHERDNEYLRTGRFVTGYLKQRTRAALARRLCDAPGERPFVYFPLHVTDDFKVKRVIPHCVDQHYLIQQLADALPQGYDLVLKEHPVSIGRNPIGFLRRISRHANVRLVSPHTSSHELIRRSRAVIVISSTVGLEALLYSKPVLTMGQPFYSGYGVTLDVDSFRELREAVPAVLRFRPDRERILNFLHAAMRSTYEGAPAGVDASNANAAALAGSLDAAATRFAGVRPEEAPAHA